MEDEDWSYKRKEQFQGDNWKRLDMGRENSKLFSEKIFIPYEKSSIQINKCWDHRYISLGTYKEGMAYLPC